MLAVDAVWGGHPHENPGRRPKNRASGLGCGIRMKTPGTVPTTGTSGLAVASDPIGFWEGVGPDCDSVVATPLFPVTDNVVCAKKKLEVVRT